MTEAEMEFIIRARQLNLDESIRSIQEMGHNMKRTAKDIYRQSNIITRSINKMKKSWTALGNTFRTLRNVALQAFTAIVAFTGAGGALTKLASDSQELDNVVQQSFGNMSKAVNSWAKEIGQAVGRSTYQMREFVAINQSVLKGMLGTNEQTIEMSKNLSQLAVDMGSFYNVADKQMMDAIRSGIMGETEPLKRYGIMLHEATIQEYALAKGISQKVSAMNQGQKVQLRYAYLMENTQHILGDSVRTIDSVANQMKVLKAQLRNSGEVIGNMLLPIVNQMLHEINSLDLEGITNQIKEFIELNKNALVDLFKYAGKVTLIISAIGLVGSALMALLSPMGLISASVFALASAWYINLYGIQEKTESAWQVIKDKWDTLVEKGVIDKIKGYGTLALKVALKFAGELWEDIKNDNWTNVFT
ncbi:hypothetical protein C7959_15715, partial [Orenia marismortui]